MSSADQLLSDVLLIGIGQDFRSDDTVGLHIARRLRPLVPEGCDVLESNGDGATLMALWKGRAAVLIVDAVSGGQPPGTIRRLDAHGCSLPAELFQTSSHHWGLAEAIEMSRILDELPETLRIFGIEGQDFGHGEELLPEVEAAIPVVCDEILALLGEPGR